MEYLAHNRSVSVLDANFHEDFHARFGGARKLKHWGAQPVAAAMTLLRRLFDRRLLRRARVGLRGGEWQPGFPRWVWEYRLAPAVPPPPPDNSPNEAVTP